MTPPDNSDPAKCQACKAARRQPYLTLINALTRRLTAAQIASVEEEFELSSPSVIRPMLDDTLRLGPAFRE
jgi:ribosomal protein L36